MPIIQKLVLHKLMPVHTEGIDRIHKSMTAYVKSVSKRSEGDDKEKTLPIGHLGGTMIVHGEDYDANSDYGRCLTSKLLRSCG